MECFNLSSSKIEGRIDPFYYRPELIKLEKKIQKISKKTLNDYAISVSGGATPSKKQQSKYYSDSLNGIPFLRVQNINNEGLDDENLVYITKKTHEGKLKRSQISEFDLITKITGVGRMAVSSVAPKDFIGNLNQHLVVIKTKDRETSNVLACYLNSDLGEKLASRRSTGGTRPALDYPALKSIPIVWNSKIVDIMQKAYVKKNLKIKESKKLSESIDGFILKKLGISIPKIQNIPYFQITSNTLNPSRLDPRYYQQHFIDFEKLLNKRKDMLTIDDISERVVSGSTPKTDGDGYTDKQDGVPFIRIANIRGGQILLDDVLYIKHNIHEGKLKSSQLKPGDVLLSIAGTIGLSLVVSKPFSQGNINQALVKIELKKGYDPIYLSSILSSKIGQLQIERLSRPTVQTNLNLEEVKSIKIPIPDPKIQKSIIDKVKPTNQKSKKLLVDALNIEKNAKKQIEKLLLP